ncbi:hypothetical protein A2U01_0053155 [Trifolium medium]|uniref:Uncharacterized protein n=1 Tax=Trifolium medium TaxID=97028 RepID=A0A392R5S1_9FABA|nr:hypothetical protein [Trifolium medium]
MPSGGDLGESLLIGEFLLEIDMIVAEINEDLKTIARVAVTRWFEELLCEREKLEDEWVDSFF